VTVAPALSVVVCAERIETLRPLISRLEAQGDAAAIELVIPCPSAPELGLEAGDCAALAGVRAIEYRDADGGFVDLPAARAAGVRAATAPLVVLGETHCMPAPGWSEGLIGAFGDREPAAAGPVMLNANPATAISWANLTMDYGQWLAPVAGGPRDELPGHNSCYRRRELVARGERLERLLAYEGVLHAELRTEGRELVLVEQARVRHLNVSTREEWLRERFAAGRAFASARAVSWPAWRRALYAAAGPLIPVVRMWRLLPVARAARTRPPLWRLVAALAVGLMVSAAGEVLGFALGPGRRSWGTLTRIEIYRDDCVHPGERLGMA
jgi:hypothetical protein